MTCKECLNEKLCKHYVEMLSKTKGINFESMTEPFCENAECNDCKCFKNKKEVISLPCSPKDKIWVDLKYFADVPEHIIYDYEVYYINIMRGCVYDDIEIVIKRNNHRIKFDNITEFKESIGTSIFLIKEEAEQALKENG